MTLRIGIIGAGANTREKHVPGLRALPDVEIVGVVNRRPESTSRAAQELGIPRTYPDWEALVADPDIDAIVIGTWPYLHCPITLAALSANKHVMTEARMCMNAAEAHRMLAASRKNPDLVCQIVPSPFGLRGHQVIKELLAEGFLGELREVTVQDYHGSLADPNAPLSWRQDAALSGLNMLTLGIVHETLLRWIPPPIRVMAQVHAHVAERIDPDSGLQRKVGTPDSVQVLSILEDEARATYHFSGATAFGEERVISLRGTEGVLIYDLVKDRIWGASRSKGAMSISRMELKEIPIPDEKARHWRVEEEFVQAIREGTPIELPDFVTGVAYVEFTEAVARSADSGSAVDLPLGS